MMAMRIRVDRLEQAACFSDGDLADSLDRLRSRRAVSLPVLDGPILAELAESAEKLSYRRARFEVGRPQARVYQQFDYCGAVPPGHPVHDLGPWFDGRLHRSLAMMADPPIEPGFTINDIVCQRYRPGDLGITPHRDHIAYTGLVILLVLAGCGRYFVCPDREGRERRELDAAPGRAILMPGPGYAGRRDRPFHMVSDITSLRYSVGLRHDARRTAPDGSLRGGCGEG
jgi:hypothetical protein